MYILDYHLNVVITDLTTHSGDQSDEALVITIFRAREEQLPIAAMVGCPILFRNIRVSSLDFYQRDTSSTRGLKPLCADESVERQSQGERLFGRSERLGLHCRRHETEDVGSERLEPTVGQRRG